MSEESEEHESLNALEAFGIGSAFVGGSILWFMLYGSALLLLSPIIEYLFGGLGFLIAAGIGILPIAAMLIGGVGMLLWSYLQVPKFIRNILTLLGITAALEGAEALEGAAEMGEAVDIADGASAVESSLASADVANSVGGDVPAIETTDQPLERVSGYVTEKGVEVEPYVRTEADGVEWNNLGSQ